MSERFRAPELVIRGLIRRNRLGSSLFRLLMDEGLFYQVFYLVALVFVTTLLVLGSLMFVWLLCEELPTDPSVVSYQIVHDTVWEIMYG